MPQLPTYEKEKPYPSRVRMTSFGAVISPVQSLRNCPVNGSFVVDNDKYRRRILAVAKRLGIKIVTAKEKEGRYSVWRKEE